MGLSLSLSVAFCAISLAAKLEAISLDVMDVINVSELNPTPRQWQKKSTHRDKAVVHNGNEAVLGCRRNVFPECLENKVRARAIQY